MENTSDAKFYVEMVYNVTWSRSVSMMITSKDEGQGEFRHMRE